MIITDDNFDPEFHSGCEECDTMLSMSDLYYNEDEGFHLCLSCYNISRHNYAMEILDD